MLRESRFASIFLGRYQNMKNIELWEKETFTLIQIFLILRSDLQIDPVYAELISDRNLPSVGGRSFA